MAKKPVTEQQIRDAAYYMWQKAGEPEGRHEEFWLRAESQLNKPAPRKRAPAKKPAAKKPAAKKPAAKPRATKAAK